MRIIFSSIGLLAIGELRCSGNLSKGECHVEKSVCNWIRHRRAYGRSFDIKLGLQSVATSGMDKSEYQSRAAHAV
jgi:hypothetical protein